MTCSSPGIDHGTDLVVSTAQRAKDPVAGKAELLYVAATQRCSWNRPDPVPAAPVTAPRADVAAALIAGTAGYRRHRQPAQASRAAEI